MIHYRFYSLCWIVAAVVTMAVSGCGAVEEARRAAKQADNKNKMKIMVLTFHNHHDVYKQGPPGWDEFISFAEQGNAEAAPVLKELRKEGVVFFCDVRIQDAIGGSSNSIFAYEAETPKNGGLVALMDGSVMAMTAEDFAAMLAAQKKDSPKTTEKLSS